MKNSTPNVKVYFDPSDYQTLKGLSERKRIPLSILIRSAALAYLSEQVTA